MGTSKKSTTYQIAVGGITGVIRLLIYACLILMIVYAGRKAYNFGYAVFNQIPVATEEMGEDITVVIQEGQSALDIGKVLVKKGLLEDAFVFSVQERLSNYHKKLLPGTYILNTSQTADEMMAVMAQEDTQPD